MSPQDLIDALDAAELNASPADDMQQKVELLRQLGELRDRDVLTNAEFDAKKAAILG